MRKKYNISDKIVIGHVGAFNYQKNHEYLIKIFSELCNRNIDKYFLVLIGDGELRKDIEIEVRNFNIENNVLFVGITDEVNKWLQATDIMILPSRFEGFPNVLVEWQIAGLPCIISNKVTDKVKITDLVQFASIDDKPEIWAEKIENIKIEDREKNKQAVSNEIKKKGFDIKENAKNLEKLYFELVEERLN